MADITPTPIPATAQRADRAGLVGAIAAALIGAWALVESREFSDLGAVFPRTIGALLVAMGVAYAALVVSGRTRAGASVQGSTLRRAIVAVVMLAWSFALGPLGFVPSSAAACAALLVVAHHGRWQPGRAALHGVSTAALLALLVILFQHVLLVPLP